MFSVFIRLFGGRGDKQVLVQMKKRLKEKKMLVPKKIVFHLENELEQSVSALPNYLKVNDSVPFENTVSKRRILSLIAPPTCHS